MKIKTSTSTVNKTAPAPPPSPPVVVGEAVKVSVGRSKPGCTWTCCDYALLTTLVVMIIGAFVIPITLRKVYGHYEDNDDDGGRHGRRHYVAEPVYIPATCRVAEIIDQGEVCCGSKCNCKPGLEGSLDRARWYNFQDEATNDRELFEEWEMDEEFEREEFEEIEGEEDDFEEEEGADFEREKRSVNGYQKKSFSCYKIVLEGRQYERPHRMMTDHHGPSEEEHDDEDEEAGEPEFDRHHGDRHDGSHEGHRQRRSEESDEEDVMEEIMEEMLEEVEEDENEEPETQELLSREFKPEAGLIVVEGQAHENEVQKAMFYDGQHTMENYMQCSYSACSSRRCQNNVDIEEKMKKWRMRLDTQESFDCSVNDPRATHRMMMHEEEDSDEDSGEDSGEHMGFHRHHGKRMLKLAIIPYAGIMLVLLTVLIVRRAKVTRANRLARCSRYAAPKPADSEAPKMTKEEEANLPPLSFITKEQEANMPPSAPPVAWTLPDYDKAAEMPPVYTSTPDIGALVALSVAQEAEKKEAQEKKDSEA